MTDWAESTYPLEGARWLSLLSDQQVGKVTAPFALARQRQRRLSLRKLQLYRGDPKLCGVSRTERPQ